MTEIMKLFDFATCPRFKEKINGLAAICLENWGQPDEYKQHPVLHNYIKHTFSKLYFDYENAEEDKKANFLKIEEGRHSIFNTGLYDGNWQKIYAYFIPNTNTYYDKKWYFDAFMTEYQLTAMGINPLPPRANYFTNIQDLTFNVNYQLVPQYDHIFDDENNNQRIPESVRNSHMKAALFDSAITLAKKRIDANYKVAVPQYYKNKIQLLIPIYLTNLHKPDLALAVSRDDENKCYLGHTCLTMEWAYNNARLIAKPDSDWLLPV